MIPEGWIHRLGRPILVWEYIQGNPRMNYGGLVLRVGVTLYLYFTFPPMAGVVELFDAVLQVGIGFNKFLTVCILADDDV